MSDRFADSPDHDRDDHDGDHPRKKLGSLAQSAREKKIAQARTLLIVIGVLTVVANIIGLVLEQSEVEKVLAGVPAQMRSQASAQIWTILYAVYGSLIVLGAIFIFLGIIVKQYPVPITILSLVLYILANVVLAVLNPAGIAAGAIIKVFIIVGLVGSVQAAFAYEQEKAKEVREAERERDGYDDPEPRRDRDDDDRFARRGPD